MPQRNVATNFTFEQQRAEINLLAQDFWTQKGTVDTAASTYLKHDGSNNFTGGTLAVPNAFTINSNSGNGTVTIAGNLQVDGTTTTVNTATMDVVDKNITIAKGSANDAAADGAGITIDSATDITLNFVDANDAWVSSIGLEATTFLKAPYGHFTGSTTATTGSGVEVFAPDANTGQIQAYNRGSSAFNELRFKGASVGIYTGTSNAIVGTFNSTGLTMEASKGITCPGDLDVDGTSTFGASGSITAGANFSLSSNKLRVTGTDTVGLEVQRAGNATIQCTDTTNSTDLQLRANSDGGLVRTATEKPLIFGTYQEERLRIHESHAFVTVNNGNAEANSALILSKTDAGYAKLEFDVGTSQKAYVELDASENLVHYGATGVQQEFYAGGSTALIIDSSQNSTFQNGLLTTQGAQEYASSANTLATSVTKAALRVKGATNSSDSLWMGVETTDATPYIQGSNGVGNLAKKLLLNPFGGNVGIGLVDPDCEFHVKGAGSVARFEGTGGSSFLDLYDSDDNTRCFVGVDGGTFKVQTSANSWSDKLSVTPAGVVIVGIDNNDTNHTDNSLPAGVSGLYTRNSNGTTGTFSAISLIASSSGAASDQSASLVAKCTASGLSPEVYLTQRDGNNSQRNVLAINTLGDATFIGAITSSSGSISDNKGDLRNLPRNEKSTAYTAVTADKGKFLSVNSNVTFDNSATWNTGDVVTVYNWGASPITIVDGTGVLIHYTDGTTASTGDRTLASRGLCTLLCVEGSNNTFVISGALT